MDWILIGLLVVAILVVIAVVIGLIGSSEFGEDE